MRTAFFAALALILMIAGAQANEPILLSAASTANDADRALVFIHGLLGNPMDSFGKWPQIIASDSTELPGHGKLSDMAVYAVDYAADFKSRGTLEDSANSIAQELAASPIFERHRHVWFVAHSMGGLVLKRTLALWKLQGKTVLLDRVIGIGMMGVPSGGAPLADLVSKGGANEIARLFGWDSSLVNDLTTDSGQRYLDSLENDWLAAKATRDSGLYRRFTPITHCGYETKPESKLLEIAIGAQYGTIVPKLFAQSSCDLKDGFSVSHTELIKPDTARAAVHSWLRNLIRISATAAIQEERDQITTSPEVPSYLASRVDFSNQDRKPANLDRATGLPREPEIIDFADERSRQLAAKLVLQGGPFTASTKADLWESIAGRNDCIEPKISPNRLRITLAIRGDPITCNGGKYYICPSQSCDISGQRLIESSPITIVYRVCSGEYERACQPHDVYMYCYSDVSAWAKARCGTHTVQRVNTYGGNKCGYSIDAVICTSPR